MIITNTDTSTITKHHTTNYHTNNMCVTTKTGTMGNNNDNRLSFISHKGHNIRGLLEQNKTVRDNTNTTNTTGTTTTTTITTTTTTTGTVTSTQTTNIATTRTINYFTTTYTTRLSPARIYCSWLLCCLVTILPKVAEADYWSDWNDWSLCSRTCGGGSSYRLRKCIPRFLPQHSCKGDTIEYTTCNNEMCPNPTDDFRAQQCTAYDDKMYFGQYFTWIPYRNPSDPCSLYCLAVQGNIVKSLAPKVLDGTRCNSVALDMCINGKCWSVGCDHRLNSAKQFDQCGECGGNNTCITSTPFSTESGGEGGGGGVDKQMRDVTIVTSPKMLVLRDRKLSDKSFDNSSHLAHNNDSHGKHYLQHSRQQHQQQQQKQHPYMRHHNTSNNNNSNKGIKTIQDKRLQQQLQQPQENSLQQRLQDLKEKFQQQQPIGDEEINDDDDDDMLKLSLKKGRKKKKETLRWEVKYGECSVTCSLGVRQPKKVCVDTKVNAVVAEELCSELSDIELPPPKNCSTYKCPPRWEAQEWQPCTMTCGGGTSLREVSCMEYGPSGQARWVEDQFCKQFKPSEYKSCNTVICPRWYAGEWSPCSVTCGFGIQHRVVICRNSGNNTCVDGEKPTTSQTCTTNLPCFQRSGDIQETLLTDYIESSPPKYGQAPNISKLDLSAPRFIPYDWSPCSVTCGTGVKTRRIPCKIFLQFLNEVTEVPHKECTDAGEEEPVSSLECKMGVCVNHASGTIGLDNNTDYTSYVWKLTNFTFSSGNNVEETKKPLQLSCYDAILNSKVNQTYCPDQPILYLFNKWCSSEFMCFGWYNLDEYTPCKPTCGNSTQQRLVACVEESTQGDKRKFSSVANKFCLNPMPKMLKTCVSAVECPASWGIGSWEKCSVSCSGGLQRRWLRCQKTLPDGAVVNVSDTECADITRQRSIRVCNSFPCQKPRIKEPVKKFFQLTHSMAINIFTGAHAYVLPATILTVRCLARGIDRSTIEWFRNGLPLDLATDLRVNYSRNSLHRIKVQTLSTPNQSENYTCRCRTVYNNVSRTLESTVILHLISLIDILRETAHRESYLMGTITSPYANVTDPADKRPKRAYYVNSPWSSCVSSTCKRYGRQTRNVSCEIITTNYFEELPTGVCKRGRLKRPEVKRKCRMDCFKWITYEWGKCHPMFCIQDNISIQRRRIVCYDSMSHSITRRRNCDNLTLPPLQRRCSTPFCQSNWKTATTWKKCHGKCGSYGVQTRSMWCLWDKTGLPAKNNCYNKLRPLVKRTCKMPSCKHGGTNQ